MSPEQHQQIWPLTRDSMAGDRVWWEKVTGDRCAGVLVEWDNWTAIIRLDDGTEEAVAG